MKSCFKRLTAVSLSLVMVLSLSPIGTFALDPEETQECTCQLNNLTTDDDTQIVMWDSNPVIHTIYADAESSGECQVSGHNIKPVFSYEILKEESDTFLNYNCDSTICSNYVGEINIGNFVGAIDPGDIFKIENVDFGNGYSDISLEIGTPFYNPNTYVEIYLDDIATPCIARIALENTGNWEEFKDLSALINCNVTGAHTVYVKSGSGAANFNVKSLKLSGVSDPANFVCNGTWSTIVGNAVNTGSNIGSFQPECIIRIENVDFGEGYNYMVLTTASDSDTGVAEIYLDDRTNLIATVPVTTANGWDNYSELAPVVLDEDIVGKHTIYIKNVKGIYNVKSFRMINAFIQDNVLTAAAPGKIKVRITATLGNCEPIYKEVLYSVILSDVNGDHATDIKDLVRIKKIIAGITDIGKGDLNFDNDVNATDMGMLKKMLLSNVNENKKVNKAWSLSSNNAKLNSGEIYYFDSGDATEATSDFESTKDVSLADLKELVNKLDDVAAPSDVDKYSIHEDGGLIYNPIYQEAVKTGILNKYNRAHLAKGTIKTGNSTLTYQVPKYATAYDTVPIKYTLTSSSNEVLPVHVEANSFEESSRLKGNNYYDMNIPGTIRMKFDYQGYVAGTYDYSTRPQLNYGASGENEDKLGTAYPNIDTSKLVLSSEIPASDRLWFKVRYTNVGNTIIDPEGDSSMQFVPTLEKYNTETNEWSRYAETPNFNSVMADYLYPGESGEIWFTFQLSNVEAGEYRMVIRCDTKYEGLNSSYAYHNADFGIDTQVSKYEFTVKETADVITPENVTFTDTSFAGDVVQNSWLHSFQEFMSSYDSWLKPNPGEAYTGVLYLQINPWATEISLKLINSVDKSLSVVRIPIEVDTESVKINFNPNNINYVADENGNRTPMIISQNMMDMRTNISLGPNGDEIITQMLLEMKNAGINTLTNTNAFIYDQPITNDESANKVNMQWNVATDAYKFSMDASRKLGLKYIGEMTYPYYSNPYVVDKATNQHLNPQITSQYSDPVQVVTNIAKALFAFNRWGDLYCNTSDNSPLLFMEDTRGRRFANTNYRYSVGTLGTDDFRQFVKTVYGNISVLNTAWNTNYTSFDQIMPEADGVKSGSGFDTAFDTTAGTGTFSEWTKAMRVFDIYRTVNRVTQYKKILDGLQNDLPDSKLFLTQETCVWVAPGLSATTKNSRYRYSYYNSQRAAMIPEILTSSATIYAACDYNGEPCYRPSEIYEMTRRSVEYGVIPMWTSRLSRVRDYALNDTYGTDVTNLYNLATPTKEVTVNNLQSVFMRWVATYEAGGVPGILWNDYGTGGTVTATQIKEMKFFKEKMAETLNTPQGKAWKKLGALKTPSWQNNTDAAWSYDQDYVNEVVDRITQKFNINNDVPLI